MIKKITIGELRPGMYVCGFEKGEAGKALFFMNNILMKTAEDAERFVNNGYSYVYIDIEDEPVALPDEGLRPPGLLSAQSTAAPRPAAVEDARLELLEPAAAEDDTALALAVAADKEEETGTVGFEEELEEAKRVRDEAESIVREFLSSARNGTEIRSEAIDSTVGKMVDSVFRNQDALASLARLKSHDDYTFAHSVNVCILSLALGRHMGLAKGDLHDLGVGALLHDVGKTLVPGEILNKPGKLTEAEFSQIKRHSELGGEFLSNTKAIREESLLVALQHHERVDGSGYHRGLSGKEIHLYARIAAVADVYDAMTSKRVYQKSMQADEALKKMYTMRGTHFEPEIVERLIKCLGIYPIGTIVELNTGETAVVKMINHTHPLQPRVVIVSDRDGAAFGDHLEADLKEEIGRWIVASKRPGELGRFHVVMTA